MAEAHNSVHLVKLRATLHRATITIALQRAQWAIKAQLQRQGRKPMHTPHREIVAAANVYLRDHREELIAEAKEVVERWAREGFFGKRCAELETGAQRAKA